MKKENEVSKLNKKAQILVNDEIWREFRKTCRRELGLPASYVLMQMMEMSMDINKLPSAIESIIQGAVSKKIQETVSKRVSQDQEARGAKGAGRETRRAPASGEGRAKG